MFIFKHYNIKEIDRRNRRKKTSHLICNIHVIVFHFTRHEVEVTTYFSKQEYMSTYSYDVLLVSKLSKIKLIRSYM